MRPATGSKEVLPFYLRRASGEKLSPKGLERSLIKDIKRSFRERKDLKPGSTICVFVPPGKIIEGVSLHVLLSVIERTYGSSVSSFFPASLKESGSDSIIGLLNTASSRARLYEVESNFDSLPDVFRYSINEGSRYCSNEGSKLPALLPFTLTDIVEGFIESMVFENTSGGLRLFNELLNDSMISLPFRRVTRTDVLAYAYSKSFMDLLNCCPLILGKGFRRISDAIAELEMKHSELLYSTLKSLKKLLGLDETH